MKITARTLALACLCGAFTASAQYKAVNPQVSRRLFPKSPSSGVAETLQETRGLRNAQHLFVPGRPESRHRRGAEVDLRTVPQLQPAVGGQLRPVPAQQKSTAPGSRIPYDVDLYNVVAVLPGTTNKDQRIIVSGHYDTVNNARPAGSPAPQPGDPPGPPRDPNVDAPGVTDDGSGTACVMELARVMSQYQFEKTIVFVAFAGEEAAGLLGSTLYAAKARSLRSKNRSRAQQRHHRQRRRRRRPHRKSPGEHFQRRSHRFPVSRNRPLHQGSRRALRALHDRRPGVSRRPLWPRRRPHAVQPRRIRRHPGLDSRGEFRESALAGRYLCKHVAGLCRASHQGQRSGSGIARLGAEIAGYNGDGRAKRAERSRRCCSPAASPATMRFSSGNKKTRNPTSPDTLS